MTDFPPNLSIRPLTIEDLAQSVHLESRGFPEHERASKEKLAYRLTVCPELCSGLFIRDYVPAYRAINTPELAAKQEIELKLKALGNKDDKGISKSAKDATNADADDADDDDDDDDDEKIPEKSSVIKETLIGHIIATKIPENRITNESMELPTPENPKLGHVEYLRFIGIHGLVIDPDWQGKNLGTLLIHDYIQKLSNQDLGDKVVIIAHKKLVPFYEKIGFNDHGESDCKFAGEVWHDLTIDLVPEDED